MVQKKESKKKIEKKLKATSHRGRSLLRSLQKGQNTSVQDLGRTNRRVGRIKLNIDRYILLVVKHCPLCW